MVQSYIGQLDGKWKIENVLQFPIDSAPKDGTVIIVGDEAAGDFTMRWGHIQKNALFPGITGMWVDTYGALTWQDTDGHGPTYWRYPFEVIEKITDELDEAEAKAVLYCERDGNGKYIYRLPRLIQKGLMSLTPIPELQMVPAYRLNPLGLSVRQHLTFL